MAPVIKPARRVKHVDYELSFDDLENPGCGYGFPCYSKGKIGILEWLKLHPLGRKNLRMVRHDPKRYPARLECRKWTETIPAVIECVACGSPVELIDQWASSCPKCGTEYNGCGQRLAPRSQWEFEGDM
jgi:hypothetical protein